MHDEKASIHEFVINTVDTLLLQAIAKRASDIHLEPTKHGLRVRFRIDGLLIDQNMIAQNISEQVIARLKILANINSAEYRVPQDGKLSFSVHGRSIDIRLSTFPVLYGEKVVVRILDSAINLVDLYSLGFSLDMFASFKRLLSQESGFLLVTGPTGSGKTTTLYSAISSLNTPDKNIVTLEDPIEYELDGITQAQINPVTGFTFEKGIRSLLRQDPNILMVGEIRDPQTARIAIQAALTGHLVLSTIHTNDAPSVIVRLMNMGIEPFLIAASLTGVLSQRLVRILCQDCKAVDNDFSREQLDFLALQPYKAVGCNFCNGLGLKGRTGVFELLEISSELRRLIMHNPHSDTIYQQAYKDGMSPLSDDVRAKINDGIVSIAEAIRLGLIPV